MSARRPSISAIVATRDRPRLLADALRSIERQRLSPLEVRVADDGESSAAPVVGAFAGLEVTLLQSDARQIAATRNLAANGARGDVLAFLDDDDRWGISHLESLADAFASPDVQIAYTDAAIVRERVRADGAREELERRIIARDWDPAMMRENDYVPPSALAVRRALFERLGGFDTAFDFSEDWDFLLRAAAVSAPRRVPGASAEVRLREHGNASADFGAARLACLACLAERHRLPALEPRTFWEVAALAGEGARR